MACDGLTASDATALVTMHRMIERIGTTMHPSPLSPAGFLLMELRRRITHARQNPDLGASAIEWVIITGVLVAIAAAVGLVIYNMVTSQAESIDIPDAPGGGGGGGAGGT